MINFNLSDKIDSLLVSLVGNRVDAIAKLLTGVAVIATVNDYDTFKDYLSATSSLVGISALMTVLNSTKKSYVRTRKHIEQTGQLAPLFVERYSLDYCSRQGVYLAAKKMDQIEKFREGIKNISRPMIPNF